MSARPRPLRAPLRAPPRAPLALRTPLALHLSLPRALGSGLAAAALALAGACGTDVPAGPNVLVITIDTVRADRLGAYGHTGRDITPRLDALAAESVLFEHAFASSSFTPPTHASIFTGLHPPEHGMLHWNKPLGDVPTAAALFRAAGWRTFGISPLPTLFKLGLERGFEQMVSPAWVQEDDRVVLADADALNAAALSLLTAPAERPFFAWIHYYDAHRPYGRQGPEWSGRYVEDDDAHVGASEAWYQLTPAKRAALGLTSRQTALMKDHYDGGLAYLDDRVGRLLDGLAGAGVLEDTIIVVIADHGEVLDEYEAEWFSHDPWLVDENTHVPFLLRLPGARHAGARVPDLVSQVDVLPTLLSLAGVPAPPDLSGLDLARAIDGASLGRALVFADRIGDDLSSRKGDTPPTAEQVAASRDRKRSLRGARRKLLHAVDRDRIELYAVDGTAPEGEDVQAQDPAAYQRLLEAYLDLLDSLRPPPGATEDTPGLDPATEEFLRGIGYR
jgi:arylsulfatase A-like enzyme